MLKHSEVTVKTKLKFISIFTIVILVSFIPEMFPEFFGDWVCKGGSYTMKEGHYVRLGCLYGENYQHNPTTHWGFRHWMWTLCGISLFIWNIIDLFPKKWRSI
jgi:TRAP-type mannitol/chloroaromatic compound transport system permease small subunit